ncbi:MAG: hypothetical protein HYY76_12100 [Acidobacteria bacterium]|nr:hypothetical protein [Acidobacteriota bacterium]
MSVQAPRRLFTVAEFHQMAGAGIFTEDDRVELLAGEIVQMTPIRSCENGMSVPMVPPHLRLLFWDTNTDRFDPAAYPRYTIERVLEYGDEEAVAWMRRTFTHDQILEVLRTDRNLTPLSANFWAMLFGVPVADVVALRDTR